MRTPAVVCLWAALLAGGCAKQKPAEPAPRPPEDAPATEGPAAGPREEVENPQYRTWAKFPPGTVAVQRTVTETEGNDAKTVTTVTFKLLEKAPDHVKLESQASTRRYDGHETHNPPNTYTVSRTLQLPPGVKKEDFGKPKGDERGEETIVVERRSYKTNWYKGKDRNEAGEVFAQTWISDEVPGGLVKSITRTPAIKKLSVIELTAVRVP